MTYFSNVKLQRTRYRYLDGWREKETRAGLLFGRAFERPWPATSTARMQLRSCGVERDGW